VPPTQKLKDDIRLLAVFSPASAPSTQRGSILKTWQFSQEPYALSEAFPKLEPKKSDAAVRRVELVRPPTSWLRATLRDPDVLDKQIAYPAESKTLDNGIVTSVLPGPFSRPGCFGVCITEVQDGGKLSGELTMFSS
jgi:hypothetical protein